MTPIRTEARPGWRKIVLNRPERLNAFTVAMHEALAEALDEAAADAACRAVLLTGEGRGFCAGQDLNDRVPDEAGGRPDLGATIERYYNPLVRRLRGMEKPVVCAVNGVAAGAGANMALACDIVLAAKSAKFIQAFVRIGLVPDSGGTYFLPRLIGDARARALAITGDAVDAAQAAQWGLIWQAVDDDRLMAEAEALTARLATQPTRAIAMIKALLNRSGANDLDAQLNLERDLQRAVGDTTDYLEGVQAFLEKREPRFAGR